MRTAIRKHLGDFVALTLLSALTGWVAAIGYVIVGVIVVRFDRALVRLTARENSVYYGALHGMEREAADARAQDLARMFDMTALLDRRAAGFSQGERMKTALVRALVHDPANIVLDEPTNGLDVLATRALRDSLRWLRSPEGGAKCIVFSTHIMQEVERLCDSVVVVAHGRTVATGTVPELLAQTDERDFEEAFVKLAFVAERGGEGAAP